MRNSTNNLKVHPFWSHLLSASLASALTLLATPRTECPPPRTVQVTSLVADSERDAAFEACARSSLMAATEIDMAGGAAQTADLRRVSVQRIARSMGNQLTALAEFCNQTETHDDQDRATEPQSVSASEPN